MLSPPADDDQNHEQPRAVRATGLPGRCGVPESDRSPECENGVRGVHWRPNRDTLSLAFSVAISVSD